MPANGCAGIKPGDADGPACTPPVTDWDRGGGGTSIGGRILDGCNWPADWKKRYIFGDHEQGKVWTIEVNATRDGVVGARTEFASTSGIAAIKMGTDNALYLVERGAGRVARVTLKADTAMPGSCQDVYPDGDPGNPSGGAGGGGNAAGNGNAGGNVNPGGGSGTGGSGNTTSGSGNVNPGAGTNSATGGTNGATDGGASADEGGCGCRAVGTTSGSVLGVSFLAGALGLALKRRRRSRRS
jgi:MYXO-CTERM domain-containing protein